MSNPKNKTKKENKSSVFSRSENGRYSVRSAREQMVYLVIFLLFVMVSTFIDFRSSGRSFAPETESVTGWTNETGAAVDLDKVPLGDHSFTLDVSGLTLYGKSLCMKSIDTNFAVYADDELIYDYHPKIPKRFGLSYGIYVHTVAIPEGTKDLKVDVQPVFVNAPADLNDVVIADATQYMVRHFRRNIFSFLQCAITLLIGILFLIVGLSSALSMRSAGIDFIALGAACSLVGFYGFNDTLMLQVMTGHPELIRVLSYVCLIFLPFPVLSFISSVTEKSGSNIVSGMVSLCLFNFIMQLMLTRLGISDYYYLVYVSHAIVILSFVISFIFIIQAKRRTNVPSHLLHTVNIGLIVCIICVAIDIVRTSFFTKYSYSTFTRIAVLIFTVLMLNSLFRSQINSLNRKNKESRALVGEIAKAFAKVIDMKDNYTKGHSNRVAKYTAMLSRELGYDEETVEKHYNIALLHDVGKIGVPITILNKPGKLTDEEYSVVKSHTTNGYEVLRDISIMPDLAIGAQSHHERPDGKGYPMGLNGKNIPRVAQIIAVADCFDAMYSDRPYRKRMDFDKVVSIIKEVSGTQLAPDVVDSFLRLVEKGEIHPFDEHDDNDSPDQLHSA